MATQAIVVNKTIFGRAQGPVVPRVNNVIRQVNHYPLAKC